MPRTIEFKTGRTEVIFDESDFAYWVEYYMGYEAEEYFRDLVWELEKYREKENSDE